MEPESDRSLGAGARATPERIEEVRCQSGSNGLALVVDLGGDCLGPTLESNGHRSFATVLERVAHQVREDLAEAVRVPVALQVTFGLQGERALWMRRLELPRRRGERSP